MPRRATRARRIKVLDIEAGGGVLDIEAGDLSTSFFVCSISFQFFFCWSRPADGVVVGRELWGQPDDTPHRNGTDDRALARALALAFPAGAIGLFIWLAREHERRDRKQSDTTDAGDAAADNVADNVAHFHA